MLIERYIPLARSLALRYRNRGEPLDDLMQVASLGLVKAVDRWEPERGVALSSFAVPTILGELRRYFRDSTWIVRPPRDLVELALTIERVAPAAQRDDRPRSARRRLRRASRAHARTGRAGAAGRPRPGGRLTRQRPPRRGFRRGDHRRPARRPRPRVRAGRGARDLRVDGLRARPAGARGAAACASPTTSCRSRSPIASAARRSTSRGSSAPRSSACPLARGLG